MNTDSIELRPFTKVVSMVGGTASSITLTDSAGNLLNCNFVEAIMINAATLAEYLVLTPSGVSQNPAITMTNANASGTYGFAFTGYIPALFISPDTFSAVTITHLGTITRNVIITYGVGKINNQLKGSKRFIGS